MNQCHELCKNRILCFTLLCLPPAHIKWVMSCHRKIPPPQNGSFHAIIILLETMFMPILTYKEHRDTLFLPCDVMWLYTCDFWELVVINIPQR